MLRKSIAPELGAAGRGEPLPASLRATLERSFGADLSEVRVHTSPPAGRLARELNADAFTHGSGIYFRDGYYKPFTPNGRWLLAHEVAHVLQQAGGHSSEREAERDADRCADLVLAGRACQVTARVPAPSVQRHASFEHRVLGDLFTADLMAISMHGPTRDEVLQRQIELLGLWMSNPDVHEDAIHKICKWITTLKVGPDGVVLTYGELNALPDYLADAAVIDSLGWDTLVPILQVIRQEGYNQLTGLLTGKLPDPPVTFADAACSPWSLSLVNNIVETVELDTFTQGLGIGGRDHYQGLLARNACHFAPFSWYRWQTSHLIARDLATKAFEQHNDEFARRARIFNGYADHFLEDSFAAGHLVNKTLVMEWFIEWAASQSVLFVPDWDIIKNITFDRQPGLAGLNLYDTKYGGPSNDPQTAQEAATLVGRVLASTVVPDGQASQFTAYQNYLTFLTSAVTQLAAADLHDYFNDNSLYVSSKARPAAFEIWGDDTLLSGANGGDGVQATSVTAQMSRDAIHDLITKGSTSITTGQIRDHFPTSVHTDGKVQDLKAWTLSLKPFAEERFGMFMPDLKRLLTSLGSPRLGIVSQDQGFAAGWSTSLPSSGFTAVNMLTHGDRLFAGSDGYVYELDPVSGKVLNSLHLTTFAGGGDTRLAADDGYLYAGVHGYAYGINLADWSQPSWTTPVGSFITYAVVSLARSGQYLYAGTNGYVYQLDPATGDVVQSLVLPTKIGGDTRIAVDSGFLYAGVNQYVYGVSLTDWTRAAWYTSVGSGVMSAVVDVVKYGNRLFTGCNGFLYALDPQTGRPITSLELPTEVGGETRIAADSEFLYAGVHGYAYGVSLTSWNAPAWTTPVGGLVTYDVVTVLAANGKLFAASDGYVCHLDPATGESVYPRVLLTYLFSVGNFDTRLAAAGPVLYAGVNGYADQIVVNDDGRPGNVFHTAEGSGGFSAWTANFAYAPKMTAVTGSNVVSSTEIFAIGADNTLYHNYLNSSGWHGWTPDFDGAPKVLDVAGTASYFGYDVFAIGTDGTLYHNYANSSGWHGWTPDFDGAPRMQEITAFGAAGGGCFVFGIGTDGVLYFNYLDYDGWHGWTPNVDGAPTVHAVTGTSSSLSGGRNDVFAIGENGILYHNYADSSGWHGWMPAFDGAPEAIAVAVMNTWSAEVEVLAVGTDGTLYRNHLNSSGWQGWNQNFGTAPAPQVAVLNAIGIGLGNNNEAFVVSTDGTLYHNTYDYRAGKWQNWSANVGTGAPVAARAVYGLLGTGGNVEVFAISDR